MEHYGGLVVRRQYEWGDKVGDAFTIVDYRTLDYSTTKYYTSPYTTVVNYNISSVLFRGGRCPATSTIGRKWG